jgi:S1-C subfamily serine protease
VAGSRAVQFAQPDIVKITGVAPSCRRQLEGSGFLYAREHVMTNAHVVAGTRTNSVVVGDARRTARVVWYDPERDLAVLYVPGLQGPVMPLTNRPAQSGADAIVLGFPLDGPYDAQGARVRDRREITGPDIYNSGNVTREVYTIRGLVRSGNSGGPMLGTDGSVLGVIFAAAADDRNTGFALTAGEAAPIAQAGVSRTRGVQTGACA